MKKKWTLLAASAALTAVLVSATAFATSELNLFINGQGFTSDTLKMKVENGTTMVSLRSIMKEFKGQLSVDQNNVRIQMPDATNLARQVGQLEQAIAATSPEDAVNTWIKGIQNRNGALQYAVMSPTLRTKNLDEFINDFWVTGGSSPHMGQVKLPDPVKLTKDTVQFTFEYPLIVMKESIGSGKAQITAQKLTENDLERWVISNIKLKDAYDTGIMIGAGELK